MSRVLAREIPFAEVRSEPVRCFDSYWRSKQRGDVLPRRQDIDPAEILDILPVFILVDLEEEPFRVRYRLCGTRISLLEEELTGRYLDELKNTPPDEKERILGLYRIAFAERRPVYLRSISASQRTGNPLAMEGAIWPLSSDGQRIDKCAVVEDFPDLG
jgi:hypothetical protein